MQQLRLLLLPFAWVYGVVTFTRNKLYDFGIFNSYSIPQKSICVGNLALGGTGKTPHVAYLANLLKSRNQTSILSRGYGRKTQGFILANRDSTGIEIGDEPKLYYSRFSPLVNVAVCEKRVIGVKQIEKLFPNNEVILLDDAFQHRAVKAGVNILITDYSSLYSDDYVVPAGNLREWKSGRKRANWVIVSKCPEKLSDHEKTKIIQKLKFDPSFVFFSTIVYGELIPFSKTPDQNLKNILLVTGISNPKPLIAELQKKYRIETISFSDHHNFSLQEIDQIHEKFDTFATDQKAIITTEKDFMRLSEMIDRTMIKNYPWMYQSIEVKIDKEEIFNNLVYQYVDTI